VSLVAYYDRARPHQGSEGKPRCGPGLPEAIPPETGDGQIEVVAESVIGGLYHDYRLAAQLRFPRRIPLGEVFAEHEGQLRCDQVSGMGAGKTTAPAPLT
jgi:hypothetical protein